MGWLSGAGIVGFAVLPHPVWLPVAPDQEIAKPIGSRPLNPRYKMIKLVESCLN